MKLAKGRKVDGVVVLKLDQLFRSLKYLITSLSEFEQVGVKFISVNAQIDMTTSAGRLMANVLGSFAEFEADLIRERTHLGLDHARRMGKTLGRPQKHNSDKIIELRKPGPMMDPVENNSGILTFQTSSLIFCVIAAVMLPISIS